MSDIRLEIAISTYRPEGIMRVVESKLPMVDGVRYVVSWQEHCNAPIPREIEERGDILVTRCDEKGQSANRNNAVAHCTGDLILIGDDDLSYHPDGLLQLIDFFDAHPEADLCTVIVNKPGAAKYPEHTMKFSQRYPKNYHAGACDISFRRSRIGNLHFHPAFGLNSPDMHCGEDGLFLLTAIRRKLNCWFSPIVIADHPHHSTSTRSMSDATLRGMACVATLQYPLSFAARLPLMAYRLRRAGLARLGHSLPMLLSGAIRAFRLRLTDRKNLW